MNQKKFNKKYILFSIVTFLAFLFLLEGGYRAYFFLKNKIHTRQRNFVEYLGWETTADVSKKAVVKGYGEIIYSTKKYGFRRFGDIKTDKIKLFVIGDSFTAAETVSDGYTYYDYLSKHNENIEIFAYGGGGYGTLQEFMILDRYFDIIQPHVVLWQFCSNDFINNSHKLESMSLFNNNQMVRPYYRKGDIEWLFPQQYGGWLDKLIQSSFLLRLCNIRLRIIAAEKKGSIEWYLSPEHPLFKKAAETTSDIFRLVKKRIGSVPIVSFSVDEPNWIGKAFHDVCKENSIDVIEGIPQAVEDAKNRGIVVDGSPYNVHWNDKGHQIAGEMILRHLNENGILRKASLSSTGSITGNEDSRSSL